MDAEAQDRLHGLELDIAATSNIACKPALLHWHTHAAYLRQVSLSKTFQTNYHKIAPIECQILKEQILINYHPNRLTWKSPGSYFMPVFLHAVVPHSVDKLHAGCSSQLDIQPLPNTPIDQGSLVAHIFGYVWPAPSHQGHLNSTVLPINVNLSFFQKCERSRSGS